MANEERGLLHSQGFTLIEVLIAMAILGLMCVVLASGISTAYRASIVSDEMAAAESLARRQIELIKNADFALSYPVSSIPDGYDGYEVSVAATQIFESYTDMQEITVTVTRGGRQVMELQTYKADR